MDPMRNADVFAGDLAGVLAEASSGGGTAEMQRALAERVMNLLDQIALAAPACPPNVQPEWMAMVGDNDVSLQQRSGLRIMGTRLNGRYISVILTPESGPQWSITCPGAVGGFSFGGTSAQPYQSDFEAPTEMEISIVDGAQVLSTHRFLSSGEAVNQLDSASQMQSRSQKIQETIDRVTQEGADVPPATGISDASPGEAVQADVAGGGGPGLGQAMAGVGRMAAGVAIAAAAGMAAAAVRREIGKSKEPVPPDGSPVKPSYIDSTVQGPLTPPWKLRVTGGPEMGHIFHLKLQTSLGRGNDNDIQILDPEISRNHLRFDVRDDALVLTDLGSSRGTLVNGRKIDQPLPMKSGQVIEIGRSRFVVEETPSPQDAAQAVVPAQQSDPAPVAESAIWYYAEKDKQQGPVTESELRKRLAAGLPAETLVWNSQLDNWETAHELGLCPAPAKEPKPAAASAPAPEVLDWFFMEKGKQQGPVTEDALRQRLATGLPVETMVWNHKLETWKPAQTLGLCGTAAAPAQPAASPVPRTTPVPEAPIWYFMEKGARLGPVAESVIRQRLATGLPPDTQVWHAKLIHWKPAHELGLCAAPAPKPASPPVTAPAPALDAPLAAAAETPIWYFMDHGVRQGPVLESLLRQRLAHGLPPDTQVWNSKLDNWKPAHSLGLCPGAAPAPAVPTPKPATTPSPAQGKTCKKCGRTLSPQHRFCAGCGSPV